MNDKALWTFHQVNNDENFKVGHPRQDMLFKLVRRTVPKGGVIVESGFGDGYLLGRLQSLYKCIGVDISSENIEKVRKRFPKVDFYSVDPLAVMPGEGESVDCFIASEVLEHMDDRELNFSIQEILRILKPGGVAIVTFPAHENLADSLCYCPSCGTSFHKWGHKQVWNKEKIEKIFSDFFIERVSEFFTVYRGNSFLEQILGVGAYVARNIVSHFIAIPGAHYLVIARKK
jgi:SAM-dependent methyltransferase